MPHESTTIPGCGASCYPLDYMSELSLHHQGDSQTGIVMARSKINSTEAIIFERYGDRLIHQSEDGHGRLLVAENGHFRSLYFDTHNKQSSMYVPQPAVLALRYTHAAMMSLVFQPNAQRSLVLGLGGGSLVKFLRWQCPHLHHDVVENRESVIKLAHGFFALPENDPAISIHHSDADMFVLKSAAKRAARYDHIFVDLFDAYGPADVIKRKAFLKGIANLLSENGVACFNLWSQSRHFRELRRKIDFLFAGQTVQVLVGKGRNVNVVVFGFNSTNVKNRLLDYINPAQVWQKKTGLRLSEYLDGIISSQLPFWVRWASDVRHQMAGEPSAEQEN